MSKSTSGIVVYALGTLVIWKSKMQSVVAQSTMQGEMIATAYGNVQIDWLHDLTSEIGIASKDITRRDLNNGLNCVTTSVSNGSQFLGRFRVRFHPKPERGKGSYPTNNPDCCHWAGFTTKNRAFQVHNFGSN